MTEMSLYSINKTFEVWSKNNPTPRGELYYTNVYTLLVAVALSAQSTDVGVNRCTENLFRVIAHPEDLIKLGEDKLKEYIRHIGLYNSKAKNLISMAQELMERHDGIVPRSRESLENLSGVGRKTANVVLNIGFGEPTLAVDTHIFRVGNRMGLGEGKTPLLVEKRLLERIESQYLRQAHHWLILHGRYVCTARNPKCDKCQVFQYCGWSDKKLQKLKRENKNG